MNEQKPERCPGPWTAVLMTSHKSRAYGATYYKVVDKNRNNVCCYIANMKTAEFIADAWASRAPLLDNKALTVEELREMDGEPVYIVCVSDADGEQLVMWALVEVGTDGGEVYLTNNLGGRTEFLHPEDFDGMHIYRRPPEKG